MFWLRTHGRKDTQVREVKKQLKRVLPNVLNQVVFDAQPLVPKGIFRGRSEDAQGLLFDRVYELNATGVEMNGGVIVGAAGAVFDVTFDGALQTAQRRADLMMPPGFGFYFYERIMVRTTDYSVCEFALLSTWSILVVREAFVDAFVFLQIVDDVSIGLLGSGADHCPIGFLNVAQSKKIGQTRQGFGRACVQNDAAHRTVESVDRADEGISRLVVFLLDVFAHHLAQGDVTAGVALYDVRGSLVDSDQMIVFIEHLQVVNVAHDNGSLGLSGPRMRIG